MDSLVIGCLTEYVELKEDVSDEVRVGSADEVEMSVTGGPSPTQYA